MIRAGTAYVHGMKHATGNFIILMDADLSHHVRTCMNQWAIIDNSVFFIAQVYTRVCQVCCKYKLYI